MTRSALAFTTVVLMLLVQTIAVAQPKASPDARRAKALFEEGIALSDEGKWAEALAAFQKSNGLVRSASVEFNIGATLRALGRYVEAKNTLEGVLTGADTAKLPLKPAFLEEVKKLLAEMYDKIVMLSIKRSPPDAQLQVDGATAVAKPDGRLELDPGRHVFTLTASGYETVTLTRTLTADDTELVLTAPKIEAKVVEKRVEVRVAEDTPFYKRFWFWTAAGAVVAGAVVVTVVATRPDAREPAGPPPSTVDRVIPAAIRF